MTLASMDQTTRGSNSDYALGYTSSEHDRLIRQAMRIAPVTERLFREAGIGPGHRVLDLGSGVGDVAMLAARLVGPTGEVIDIERDSSSIATAKARVAQAGLANVSFIQADVTEVPSDIPFDAAVGRFILMFLPDPASVLQTLVRLVRPGGVVAFHEPSWATFLAFNARPRLWSKVLKAIHETFVRAGVNPEMGPDLHAIFQRIGLPAPRMHMEAILGSDVEFIRLVSDLLISVQPLCDRHGVALESLGDPHTLADRIQQEISASKSVVSFVPMVGVWARKQ